MTARKLGPELKLGQPRSIRFLVEDDELIAQLVAIKKLGVSDILRLALRHYAKHILATKRKKGDDQ